METSVDAVILAGGLSVRFGEKNKLLEPFKGKALARHTLDLVCSLGRLFQRVIFVVSDPAVAALAEGMNLSVVFNPRPQWGLRESVRLGVEASGADSYLFFPADQPFLKSIIIEEILTKRAPGTIVYPVYGPRPGNPALYSSSFREELCSLAEGEQPRDIRARHPGACVEIPVTDPRMFLDVDTLEDLWSLSGDDSSLFR